MTSAPAPPAPKPPAQTMSAQPTPADGRILHATTVAVDGRAAVIMGPSGSGKSALALHLLAFPGVTLVADDRTLLHLAPDGGLLADAPPGLPALIEARGVGLLPMVLSGPAPVALAIDMATPEAARLPEPRTIRLLGHNVALLHKADNGHFSIAVLHYLRCFRGQ